MIVIGLIIVYELFIVVGLIVVGAGLMVTVGHILFFSRSDDDDALT